jgi:hypothetical protein
MPDLHTINPALLVGGTILASLAIRALWLAITRA